MFEVIHPLVKRGDTLRFRLREGGYLYKDRLHIVTHWLVCLGIKEFRECDELSWESFDEEVGEKHPDNGDYVIVPVFSELPMGNVVQQFGFLSESIIQQVITLHNALFLTFLGVELSLVPLFGDAATAVVERSFKKELLFVELHLQDESVARGGLAVDVVDY